MRTIMRYSSDMRSYQVGDSSYVLIEKIGQGCLGKVFRAERTKKIGTELHSEIGALKVVQICTEEKFRIQMYSCNHDTEQVWEYFTKLKKDTLKEVRNQKKVLQEDGSHIVNIKECDIFEEGYEIYLLIFMELLTPLTKILENRKLDLEEVYQLGKQIAYALYVCHKNGIYHRDLKIQNVFVTKQGDFKLGDFGISQMMTNDTSHPNIDESMWYMAPEIYPEKGQYGYSESADIYSLGILLYYLLNNGRYPFSSIKGSYGEETFTNPVLAEKMQFKIPDSPVNAGPELSKVILQMLQEPEKRIPNAGVFLEQWKLAWSKTNPHFKEKQQENSDFNEIKEEIEEFLPSKKKKRKKKAGIIITAVVVVSVCIVILISGILKDFKINREPSENAESISRNSYVKETEPDKKADDFSEVVPKAEVQLESTVEYLYEDNILIKYYGKSTEIVLPEGLKGIAEEAFADNLTLNAIEIPEGVEFIGDSAFKNCKYLKTVQFPDSIATIEGNAFSGCEKIEEMILPQNLKEIGDYAFLGCKNLKRIQYPDQLKIIGKMAFISCTSLEQIEFGTGLEKIGNSAFQSCTSLKNVIFHSKDCELEKNVFSSCGEELLIQCPENSGAHAYAVEYGELYEFVE